MNTTEDQILTMVADQRLSPEVAEELLAGVQPSRPDEDIVATGAAVRLPGAATLDEMWTLLERAEPVVEQFPRRRLELVLGATDNLRREYGHLRDSLADDERALGSWLTGLEEFAPERYGLDDFDAMFLGPFERVVLDLATEALEASCIDPWSLAGSNTGVFLAHNPDSSLPYTALFDDPDERTMLSGIPANVAYRVAYTFGLHGPVLNVDTTCSSSLVAIHLARRALQSGDCDTAIVGGINLDLLPFRFGDATSFVLSPRHICNTYDAAADGTAWGEGAGVIVLRRRADAVRDHQPILVSVPGSAVTSDGQSNGMMSPNPIAHTQAVRTALSEAGVNGRDIGYVEGHGAGTVLGDQVEVSALTEAFRLDTDERGYCSLGSAKSVVGHLKDAAGVMGFLSAALRVRHGVLPGLASLEQPSGAVDWAESPLTLHPESRAWATAAPRTAGVSSLGLSGTNAHVLVREDDQSTPEVDDTDLPVLISADSRWSLWEMLNRLVAGTPTSESIGRVAATMARRPLGPARIAIRATSVADLVEKMQRVTEVRAFDAIPEQFPAQGILVADSEETRAQSLAAADPAAPHHALVVDFLNGADTAESYRDVTADHRPTPLPVPPAATHRVWPAAAAEAEDVSDLFFDVDWVSAPRPAERVDLRRVLVVAGDEPTADAFAAEGERRGVDVVTVVDGADPGERLDEVQRYAAVAESPQDFDAVVLATGLGSESVETVAEIVENQRVGAHALFALARSLVDLPRERALTVAVVGREVNRVDGTEREHTPTRATSFGLLRVMSQELPQVAELCLDVDARMSVAEVAGRAFDDLAVPTESRPHQIVYRGEHRLRRVLERQRPEASGETEPLSVEEGSTHVIAGGTGNLGPELALFLARRGAGTVVLLSRRGLPADAEREHLAGDPEWGPRLKALAAAEELGCEIVDLRCDLTDPSSVQHAFDAIDQRGLRPAGGYMLSKQLFHQWIRDLDEEDFRIGIENRVLGTFLFAEALRERAARHLLVFSSISSLSGTKGAAECAAVNQYLDAAGPWYSDRGLPTYTVNWALILADRSRYKSRTPIPPIDFTEFHAALSRVFAAPRTLAVVARLDLAEASYLRPVLRIPLGDGVWAEAERHGREPAAPSVDEPSTGVDARTAVATAWRTALGQDPEQNPHFFDAGGTSLSVIRFVHQVAKHVGAKDRLEVADVYAGPTFEALVATVDGDAAAGESPQSGEADLDDLLARLESGEISPDAAVELMGKEQ